MTFGSVFFPFMLHITNISNSSWRITESQNVRGWKGPLWVIWSNPLPKQGNLEQAAQDLVQAGLENND